MNIRTSDPGFAKYIDNNFSFFKCGWKEPNLQIDFDYHSRFRKHKQKNIDLNARLETFDLLGSNVYLQDNHLFYAAKGLKIGLSYDNMKIKIRAVFEEAPLTLRMLFSPLSFRRNILNYSNQKYSNYHYVSRMILELPLFMLLELKKNISIIHGSCVEKNGHAIIFTGTGGCGKSTLASYLVFKKGYKLMSDNYILFRTNEVYCFPKNLRLAPISMKLLNFKPQEAKSWGKYHYRINNKLISRTAHVKALLLTTFSPKFQLEMLPSHVATGYLLSIHDFLKEFPNYTYLAFLPFLDKIFLSLIDQRRKNLENFVQNANSYILRHSKNDSVVKTIKRIQRVITDI
ncbi:MAG: hypothetical protein ACFFCW_05830 [Candidatus Hodarchaeota archaeon]